MTKYELRLYRGNKFVGLESGTKEYCEDMLKWYKRHREFFNGEFIIKAVNE